MTCDDDREPEDECYDEQWSQESGFIVKRETNRREPTLMAGGVVEGQPVGMHFDSICADKVVTKDSVMKEEEVYTGGISGGLRMNGKLLNPREKHCGITEVKNGFIVRIENVQEQFAQDTMVFNSIVEAMEFVTDYFAEVN